MKNICVHHYPCLDGFTAAWAVRRALGADVEFFEGKHGRNNPPPAIDQLDRRNVYIVDFSYPREVLLDMAKVADTVTILDHHKSAKADLEGLSEEAERLGLCPIQTVFDMDRSGARITWDWFFDGKEPPRLLKYVEDRDLWRFRLQDSKAINANLFSQQYSFELFDVMMASFDDSQTFRETFIVEGRAILRKQEKDIDEMLRFMVRTMVFSDGRKEYRVPAINLPYIFASDAAGLLAGDHFYDIQPAFAAAYWDSPEGRHFSLRSRQPDGADVSLVAKHYGGGGHKHAAGFQVEAKNRLMFDAD